MDHITVTSMKKIAIYLVIFLLFLLLFWKNNENVSISRSFSDYDKNWTVYDLGVNKSNKFGILVNKREIFSNIL